MAKIFGESIRLELESAAQKSSQEGQNGVIRREDVRRDDVETDEDGLTVVETESVVERLVLEQQVEDQKHEEDVELADDNVLGDVVQLPVAKFVS